MMGEVIRVSGRAPDVGEFLQEAMLSQRFADVALCCPGGQRFLAHRLVLSAASSYLEEVLLAHSESTGHCEPITVILAEVEGPELAAILGLVYTGSAAVPRPRLDAFLRAAQALHIRLPPLPEMMTSYLEDCKPEDIKDVKISSRVLQYDHQDPPYNRWFQPQDAKFTKHGDHDRMDSRESKANESTEFMKLHPQDLKSTHSPLKSVELRHSRSRQLETCSQMNSFPAPARTMFPSTVPQDSENDHKFNKVAENIDGPLTSNLKRSHVGMAWSDRSHQSSAMNLVRIPGDNSESTVENRTKVLRFKENPRRYNLTDDDSESLNNKGQFVSLEERVASRPALSDDDRHLPVGSNATMLHEIGQNRLSTPASSPRINSERNYEAPSKILESLFDLRVPSLHPAPGQMSSEEKPNYGLSGQDLTCRLSCCRWRPPRRHVANQVTASPWRQLARPHHSPKMQPIVLQNKPIECEPGARLQHFLPTEITRPDIIPSLPTPTKDQLSRSTASNGSFQDYEVPMPSDTNCPSEVETLRLKDRRLQDFYRAQMLFPNPQPIRPAPINLGQAPNYFRNLNPSQSAIQIHLNNEHVHQTNSQACLPSKQVHTNNISSGQECTKPKLSLPVSRLCDSTRPNEVSANSPSNLGTKMEEDGHVLGEKVGSEVTQSDSNNNNASIGDTALNRTGGGPDDHRCEQCGKTFVTRASLKVHARTHSGEKPFQCNDCGKQFSQLRNYKYHRSVHEGTREFAATCPECGKYFNDRGYLSSHMKIHRNRKEYACGECGKSFNQRVAYNMHVRIHTGVKPHQCEQCGKAFSRKMLLKQHLRTHSGERPYQCQVCHKAFADRSNMTLHTRLHSGLKPYQCTLCSKAFTKKHHLKTHLNYHTGTKPYSCPNCGLRFSQSSNMRTHYKKCTVNNPNGVQVNSSGKASDLGSRDLDGMTSMNSAGPGTPSAALTPPNSDQESSILTPMSSSLCLDVAKT